MLPFIEIAGEQITTFSICVVIGVSTFFAYIIFKIKESKTIFYIIPKICLAFGIGYVGALFFDALFKIEQNGGLKLSGMTFYGGLIVGGVVLIVLLAVFKKNRQKSIMDWLNFLTVPFLLFHFFGRLGCFMSGCCYGKKTDSFLGMVFPDNVTAGIYHNGIKVFPTQLYEAIFLLGLVIILQLVKRHNFMIYCYAYPTFRFLIEFLRGDNRGGYFGFMSPAQLISVIIVLFYSAYLIIFKCKKEKIID